MRTSPLVGMLIEYDSSGVVVFVAFRLSDRVMVMELIVVLLLVLDGSKAAFLG